MMADKRIERRELVTDILTISFAVLFLIILLCVVLYTWNPSYWEHGREFGILYEIAEYFHYAMENKESAITVLVTEVVLAVLMLLITWRARGEHKMSSRVIPTIAIIAFAGCFILYFANIFHYTPLGMLLYYYGFGLSMIFTIPAFRL